MAAGGKNRDSREARERGRVYQARQQLHRTQLRRRTRDNVIAGVVGGVLILGVAAAQSAYFLSGPGMPEPSPSESSTPAPSVSVPEETPAPSDPAPSEAPADPAPTESAPG